jgi:hypothetical protein
VGRPLAIRRPDRCVPLAEAGGQRHRGEERSFFFCPHCGTTVYYWTDPEQIAVLVGAFADRNIPAPRVSVWEDRMHPWVGLPEGIEHIS